MKGAFITLYGVNNIGKSTHAKLLAEHLQKNGFDVVYLKYPIYDLEPTGPEINRVLRLDGPQRISEKELQTLFMQNRRDYEPTIKKMLQEGKIIVAEDYTGTGIAWGTAKGLDQVWVEELNDGLMKEDFTVMITGKRDRNVIEKNHIHENDDALVSKVGMILQSLAVKHDWHVVQLREKIPDTAAAIWKEVSEFIERHLFT